MAGTVGTFTLYDEQYHTAQAEVAQQGIGMNAQSGNTIRLVPRRHIGRFIKETFFPRTAGLIQHRDDTDISTDVADKDLTNEEHISVQTLRQIGPFAKTRSSLAKIGMSEQALSFAIGQMVQTDKMIDHFNTALSAVAAGITAAHSVSAPTVVTKTTTLKFEHLVDAVRLFGDKGGRIAMWVMHSKQWYDLIGTALTNSTPVDPLYMTVLQSASAPTFNRPVLIVDSPALLNENSSSSSADDTYNVLGLTPEAVTVMESEDEFMDVQYQQGKPNLILRGQGEYGISVGVKGIKWSAGTANPTTAQLASSGNWTKVASDIKDTAGVKLVVK